MSRWETDRLTTTRVNIKLNNVTDKDILEWLSQQANKQGYIKGLIRADMERGADEMMIINALDENEKAVKVRIAKMGERHVEIDGKEFAGSTEKLDPALANRIYDALDGLYDWPIYENGRITSGGHGRQVMVWQDAELVD